MGFRLAAFGEMLARDHAVFVFGMNRDAAPAGFERGKNIVFFVQQQRAGGRTQERLDAAHAGHFLKLGQRPDILRRRAGIESMVAIHASLGACQLVFDRRAAGGGRIGVGHLEHRGDPAQDRGQAAAGQVLLVAIAGFAEMHLGVHHAGQHMQALGIEQLGRFGGAKRPDGGDTPVNDPHVGRGNAVGGGNCSAPDQQIETFLHGQGS